jgi:hypothetical protein
MEFVDSLFFAPRVGLNEKIPGTDGSGRHSFAIPSLKH